MNLEKINSQYIATLIANYLQKNIQDLPTYFYQIGEFGKNGLIINTVENENIDYFGKTNNYYDLQIRVHYVKNLHQKQLRLIDDVLDNLLHKDFKDMFAENDLYLSMLYVNNKPNPLKNWIKPILETFDELHQVYYLNVRLVLNDKIIIKEY